MDFSKKLNENYTNPLTGRLVFDSIKPLDLKNFNKEDLKAYLNNSYDLYETLFTSLKFDSVYYLCPDRLRLPLIFYYGHTAAVFVNKLCLSGLIKPNERVDFHLEMTFETGVDEMSWDDIENYRMGGNYKWPTVEETKQYRLKVRELINKVIERTPLNLPVDWNSPWWTLLMGFEHERIHFETSTVLIRQYPIELVQRPTGWSYAPFKIAHNSQVIDNEMIKVPETNIRLGKSFEFPSFGWDNEYGHVDCKLTSFEASKFKVTNEQFLEFVLDAGYETRKYWSDEGWEWVLYKKAKHPLFWVCPSKCKSGCGGTLSTYSHCQDYHFSKEQLESFKLDLKNPFKKENIKKAQEKIPFKFRLMFDIVDMPRNWPVEVNYHEAKAFCKWKGVDYRLLTEAEHHAIRDNDNLDLDAKSDLVYQTHTEVNHNMSYGSSTPVNMYPSNTKGFNDVFGNVWEWCEDNFNGLPEGKTHYLYDDFSTPCYDGRHNLIMGGSWASTGDEASCFARFMFRRHFYQHCGFRIARSLSTKDGSKPNPQIRLISDRIFVLGAGTPVNKLNLDPKRLELNFYKTTNRQYFYDSHLHPEYLDDELICQYDERESIWFDQFINNIKKLLSEFNVELITATEIGCSVGRCVFELAKIFEKVIGIDFCGKFLDIAIKLQKQRKLELSLQTKADKKIIIDITDNLSISKCVFKQMTWIPNEIPKSDLVLFTMIDRVSNELSWLKRFREIVKPNGLLIIDSKSSKWNGSKLADVFSEIFDLVLETSFTGRNSFSVWRMKSTYASEYL